MAKEILGGFAIGLALVLGLAAACGPASQVDCRLRALSALPSDPELVTVREARQLVGALHTCQAAPDGGSGG